MLHIRSPIQLPNDPWALRTRGNNKEQRKNDNSKERRASEALRCQTRGWHDPWRVRVNSVLSLPDRSALLSRFRATMTCWSRMMRHQRTGR